MTHADLCRSADCMRCNPLPARGMLPIRSMARDLTTFHVPVTSRPVVRTKNTILTRNGECVGARITGDHLTVWVEGRDQEGVTVSGTPMTADQGVALARRLLILCKNLRTKENHS